MEKNDALIIYEEMSKLFPNASCELVYHNVFELAIATLLSAQSTDIMVNKVTPKLFQEYKDSYGFAKAEEKDIEKMIKVLGLYHNKASNIIALSKVISENYNGIIPNDFDKLITLPGIGRKTANVILAEGYNIPRIAVDTHVLRVANRLGIASSDNPNIIENKLMELYPINLWKECHLKYLFFGRYFCKAKNPECINCPLTKYCKK